MKTISKEAAPIYAMMQTKRFVSAMSKLLGTPIDGFRKNIETSTGYHGETLIYLTPKKLSSGTDGYRYNGVSVGIMSPVNEYKAPYCNIVFVRAGCRIWEYARTSFIQKYRMEPYVADIKNVNDLIAAVSSEYKLYQEYCAKFPDYIAGVEK